MTGHDETWRHGAVIDYTWTELALPVDAPNLALASRGVVATASTATLDPGGAINGNHTLAGWGHGNGWQAAPTQKHPNWWGDWLELVFPEARVIDTVVVYTFPEHVRGRNKMGLRDYHLQVRDKGAWETIDTVRGNVAGTIVHRCAARPMRGLRLLITATNTGDEVGTMSQPQDVARVLEVEAYSLGSRDLWRHEQRQVSIPASDRPRVAILRDDLPAVPHSAPSSPEGLGDLLRASGYTVTFLDGRDLGADGVLTPEHFDLFVHPYGPAVPLGSGLYDYLSAGGHLLAVGGYAFTEAVQWESGRWIATGWDPGLTTSVTRHADYLVQLSEQLGLFGAPGHTLRDVAFIATAANQTVVRRTVRRDGAVTGPSAVAVVGDMPSLDEAEQAVREGRADESAHKLRTGVSRGHEMRHWFTANYHPLLARPSSRWIPLVTAYDRYGRVRGTVGAVLLHHDGLYRGSRWAYFGVDNVDLFAANEAELRATLLDTVDFLLHGLTLHGVASDLDCYRTGERVTLSAIVDNAARQTRTVEVRLTVTPPEGGENVYEYRDTLTLAPGAWRKAMATWQPERFDRDLYRLEASLWLDGVRYDTDETGFTIWDEQVIARGPRVEFANNYFSVNGTRRFLLGARNDGVYPHGQVKENALWRDREYRMMRAYAQDVVSPVYVSVYVPGLGWGQAEDELLPETLLRAIDTEVQLAQKHGLIYGLCVFFVGEDEALFRPDRSRALCAMLGERYKNVPGIMFYIFDDGWREDPDVFNAWAHECVQGFAASGRTFLVTAEWSYLGQGSDVFRAATRELDFTAFSCYHGMAENPAHGRLLEMRAIGKGFSNAEFGRQSSSGSLIDHHTYLVQPHHQFGMGHSLVLNWKWKDNDHAIFPWGVVYPGDWVPKDELYTYRNSALLFRQFHPTGALPPLVVLLPNTHWTDDYMRVYPYLLVVLGSLIDLGVDYSVIDEPDLAQLPRETRAVLYPLPQRAPAHVYPLLRDFVERGGTLFLVGGDVALTEETESGSAVRQLVGAQVEEWAGPQREHLSSLSLSRALPRRTIVPTEEVPGLRPYVGQPCVHLRPTTARVAATDQAGRPIILLTAWGAGRTVYSSDVTREGACAVLPTFLDVAGVPWREADRHGAHIFTLPVEEGTVYTVTVEPWTQTARLVDVVVGERPMHLGLSADEVGLVAVNRDGAVCAVEGVSLQGPDGAEVFDAGGHVILSAAGATALQDATALVLLPVQPGTVRLRTTQTLEAVVGDVVNGRWLAYEVPQVQRGDGEITLTVDSACARSLILLATPEQRAECVRWIEASLAQY